MVQETGDIKIKISLDNSTGNFWVDMGLVLLAHYCSEGEIFLNKALRFVLDKLKTEQGKWKYPAGQFINSQAKPEKLLDKLKGKNESCDICGAINRTLDAKMWMYPFVVDPQKFGTFYPSTKRGMRICPRCALAGLAGYLGWLWRGRYPNFTHFFIFTCPDLRQLAQLYQTVLQVFQTKEEKSGSAPGAFWGPYLHETSLGLLLELFSHIESSELLSEEGRALLARMFGEEPSSPPAPLSLYVVSGKPGRVFHIQQLQEFSRLHALYQLYKSWKHVLQTLAERGGRSLQPHRVLAQVFQQFESRWQRRDNETLWRDRVCWAILEFRDPFPFIEGFLFESRTQERDSAPLRFGTLEVFRLYAKEVLQMDEQLLRVLAGFGHNLGEIAHANNEMGLLYGLRNSKNADEFFQILNDIQFRMNLAIPEILLSVETGEKIKGSSWQRVKTFLCIYAMNGYLKKASPSRKKEEAAHE